MDAFPAVDECRRRLHRTGWSVGGFDGMAQRPVQDRRSAVWFANGEVVRHDTRRQRSHFQVTEISDPVLRLQELLRDRLQPQAAFTAAESFARQGAP